MPFIHFPERAMASMESCSGGLTRFLFVTAITIPIFVDFKIKGTDIYQCGTIYFVIEQINSLKSL